MRVNDIISKIKARLVFLGYQDKVNYFTDTDILAFINDAQDDILTRTECLEGIHTINLIENVNEYQLPEYIGKILKIVDDKLMSYEYVIPEKFLELDDKSFPHYTLLNHLLLVRAVANNNGSLNIYYRQYKVKTKADLVNNDIEIPSYYDKAIEYYSLYQLLPNEKGVEFFQLYIRELNDKQGLFFNRVEKPKIESRW